MQTFIQALDEKMPEETIVDRLMEYFSDIKTSTQAMIKLKTMYQAKDESILLFNQKFRAVMERIDATSVDNIRLDLQINMYLESIKPSISKGIKGNRFYGNKYAPTTLGDAMKKAEEAYLKDIYVWGGREDVEEEQYGNPAKEVTVENIEDRQNRWSRDMVEKIFNATHPTTEITTEEDTSRTPEIVERDPSPHNPPSYQEVHTHKLQSTPCS